MDLNYVEKYKAGFLEEAAASGLSFINAPPDNPIAFIKLCGPGHLVDGAYLANINISNDLAAPLKFKCDVLTKNNAMLFQHLDFENNCNENVVGSELVHGVVFNNNECYLSYSVRFNRQYSTLPIGADNAESFYLSPFAVDPYVGDIKDLNVDSTFIDVNSLNAGNGRLLTFQEGYNYELEPETNFEVPGLVLSALAGGGLGRWPCSEEEDTQAADYVTNINGVSPNEMGQVFLKCTNDCLAIEPVKGATTNQRGLIVSANCAPCCRCGDYNKVGKFIRSYAAIYAKMAKEYLALVSTYNSVREQFGNTTVCCDTKDKMNARFKIWPQQNFMVQVQALMENNFKNAICLCESRLEVEVVTDVEITQTETIGDQEIEHTIPANTRLIITPLPEASYLYFKNVNPGNQVTVDNAGPGKISVKADIGEGLPIFGSCDDSEGGEGLPANCMESCDGYLMLTAGFTITDPKFRRIVHLRQQADANFDGLEIPMVLKFGYIGSPSDDPCAGCTGNYVTLPLGSNGVTRRVKIGPNRKSVNPCAPIRLRNITVDEDTGDYVANFPEDTNVNVTAGATLTITRRAYIGDTQEWQDMPQLTVQVPVNSQTSKIVLKTSSDQNPLTGTPAGAIGVAFTVTTSGQNMTSKCYPDPSDPNAGEDINVAPSSVTYSVRL
jgi:hypothetical protein